MNCEDDSAQDLTHKSLKFQNKILTRICIPCAEICRLGHANFMKSCFCVLHVCACVQKSGQKQREKNEMQRREYYLLQKQMEQKRSGNKGITKCYR